MLSLFMKRTRLCAHHSSYQEGSKPRVTIHWLNDSSPSWGWPVHTQWKPCIKSQEPCFPPSALLLLRITPGQVHASPRPVQRRAGLRNFWNFAQVSHSLNLSLTSPLKTRLSLLPILIASALNQVRVSVPKMRTQPDRRLCTTSGYGKRWNCSLNATVLSKCCYAWGISVGTKGQSIWKQYCCPWKDRMRSVLTEGLNKKANS